MYYEKGGHFEVHRDTLCNPLVGCNTEKTGEHPRLLTYLIYLNSEYKEEDGGTFKIYEKWPEMILQEILYPRMGSGILFRADKVHHSAEMVHTWKRAITLFINIKSVPVTDEEEVLQNELPVIRNVDMPDEMQ